jgi:hypothetical protein
LPQKDADAGNAGGALTPEPVCIDPRLSGATLGHAASFIGIA